MKNGKRNASDYKQKQASHQQSEAVSQGGGEMIRGGRLRVTFEGRTVAATIAAGSDNRRSLLLRFDGILGGFCGYMPVLADESGKYADVLGRAVGIEWDRGAGDRGPNGPARGIASDLDGVGGFPRRRR
jgi:hypothetical protein